MKCPECGIELVADDIIVRELDENSITVSHWLKDKDPNCNTWWSYKR